MKKLMVVAAAVVLSSVACGAPDAKQPTLDEVKARYAEILTVAETNTLAAQRLVLRDVVGPLRSERNFKGEKVDDFCREVDTKLDSIGIVGCAWLHTYEEDRFPKIDKRAFDATGIATNSPYLHSVAVKYGRGMNPSSVRVNCTVEELVGLLGESISLVDGKLRPMYDYRQVDNLRKQIQTCCVRPVKKYLVSQGKSFVTKDGVNPCEGLMSELNVALNAPYFNGLNEWLAKIGINASVDTSKLPSPGDAAQLRKDILGADKDLDRNYDFILKICLGVEGYNAFVREYNGEK